jgi:pyrimidine operon attenuation protein / uracil phosphoribosyltransferase
MPKRKIFDNTKLNLTIARLAHQLIENHNDFEHTVIIGLQPRGVELATRIHKYLEQELGKNILYGKLDATFYRDDFRSRTTLPEARATDITFLIEDKNVILIDDVLFTGRTIRSGLDALLDFGRPAKVELLVLIERKYSRHFPIEADYLGMSINTMENEKVIVEWNGSKNEDSVWIVTTDEK